MSQATGKRLTYDKNLLREAEVAMQEQFQLRPNRSGFASSSQARLAHPPQPPTSDGHVRFSEKAMPLGNGLSFWGTTRSKILIPIAVVVLVIIGAVVGVVVGTSVHKSQSITNNATSTSNATEGSNPMGRADPTNFPLISGSPTTTTSGQAIKTP